MAVKKKHSSRKEVVKKKVLKDQVREPVDEVTEPVVLVWEETKPGRLEASGRFVVVKLNKGTVLYDDGAVIDFYKDVEKAQDAAIDIINK